VGSIFLLDRLWSLISGFCEFTFFLLICYLGIHSL
jgi:hypothetical protein